MPSLSEIAQDEPHRADGAVDAHRTEDDLQDACPLRRWAGATSGLGGRRGRGGRSSDAEARRDEDGEAWGSCAPDR